MSGKLVYKGSWNIGRSIRVSLAYFSVFSFATFAAFGYARARLFLTLTAGAMFLATLWFLYLQAFVLHAFCRYCLFSAAIIFLLAGLVIALPPSEDASDSSDRYINWRDANSGDRG